MMKSKILFEQQTRPIKEKWKDIPGFEGYYQASTFGNIRSVERVSYYKHGKRFTKRHYQGVDLSISSWQENKIKYVTLCKDGERYIEPVQTVLSGTFGSTEKSKKRKSKKRRSIPVKCIDDDLVFQSLIEASKYYNVTPQTIRRYCVQQDVSRQRVKKQFQFM